MGKASSSKKVARAARAGGSVTASQRKLAFPLAIFAVVVLGVGLVWFARGESGLSSASAEAPTSADHWHAAYGFYVCDAFRPPLTDLNPDTTGIHTHADGIIHIHPFTDNHGGKNATLSKWGDIVGVDFGSSSITLPDGTKLENGYDCNGQPATLKVYVWPADDLEAEPRIYDRDFGDIRLDMDRAAFTIALVPDGTEVPRPDSVATLDNLTDVPGATTTSVLQGTTDSSVVTDVPTDPSVVTDPSATPDVSVETTVPGTDTTTAPTAEAPAAEPDASTP